MEKILETYRRMTAYDYEPLPNHECILDGMEKRVHGAKTTQVSLGIDRHRSARTRRGDDVVMRLQHDSSIPQRAQKMKAHSLLELVRGLVKAGVSVLESYEAGQCGH